MEWQLEVYRQHDPAALLKKARLWLDQGERERAASALDRAFGLAPHDAQLAEFRLEILEGLARRVDGVVYRYVPAGYFLIGSKAGEADERPVRLLTIESFWMAEAPVDWEQFSRVLGYAPPPVGGPPEKGYSELTKLRLQYCEDHTYRAVDWHIHLAHADPSAIQGMPRHSAPRADLPHSWREKPVIAVRSAEAEKFCQKAHCRLPTEAEWEKAARGGLIGKRYAWGDEAPTRENCDFHRFDEFTIQPSRRFPPNGYGLYAMCGGVWEWTSTSYDALAYRGIPTPTDAPERVIRGGSWSDCAEAVTVSFRGAQSLKDESWTCSPNLGLRPCLMEPGG